MGIGHLCAKTLDKMLNLHLALVYITLLWWVYDVKNYNSLSLSLYTYVLSLCINQYTIITVYSIYCINNNAFVLLSYFHKLMPRYLSPGKIKKDKNLKWSFIPDFCNDSFSPKNFQFYSISFFHFHNKYGVLDSNQHNSWKVILIKKYSNFTDVFVFYSNALLHECCIQYFRF